MPEPWVDSQNIQHKNLSKPFIMDLTSFSTPGIDVSKLFERPNGANLEERYQRWRRLVMWDSTAWALCEDCSTVFQGAKNKLDLIRPPRTAAEHAFRLSTEVFGLVGHPRIMTVVPIKDTPSSGDPSEGQKLAHFEGTISANGTNSALILRLIGEANLAVADTFAHARLAYVERAIAFLERAVKIGPSHERSHWRFLAARR